MMGPGRQTPSPAYLLMRIVLAAVIEGRGGGRGGELRDLTDTFSQDGVCTTSLQE